MNEVSWFADTASWALIVGVLTPLLTSLVQQPTWSNQVRTIVGALVAILLGVGTVLANGGFQDASGSLGIIALVMVASMATYRNLWGPKATGVASRIESATSPNRTEVGASGVAIAALVIVLVVVALILLPGLRS